MSPVARGIIDSEGNSVLWDRQEGRDCHDLIDWLAEQAWCTGKVGMSGTSYLAVAQWFTAAEQPKHLAAINPWEGVSDVYRDLLMRGGMPDIAFGQRLQEGSFFGKNQKEDFISELERYPLMSDLWRNKIPEFDRITIPAYVVASYSNTLHTAGTFRGWRRMASQDKWLRIHNSQEWPDYYDEANVEDLRCFFDRYLKDMDNGWESTPRVRYAVHDFHGGDQVNVAADAFPPKGVVLTKFYLDGRTRTLKTTAPTDDVSAAYDVASNPNAVSFINEQQRQCIEHFTRTLDLTRRGRRPIDQIFDLATNSVGPKLQSILGVADVGISGGIQREIQVRIDYQKLDAYGTPLQQFTIPNQSARAHDVTDHGASILRYKGSDGRLRVSARHLDETLSTDDVPAHSFDRVEKLSPGEIVDIEIDLLPIGVAFHPGEQLRFIVSSRNLVGTMMPGMREYTGVNGGQHVIHTGGRYASYLQLPI